MTVPLIGYNTAVKIEFREVIELDRIYELVYIVDVQRIDNFLFYIILEPGEGDIPEFFWSRFVLNCITTFGIQEIYH